MALTEPLRLRLYLRDSLRSGRTPFFTDEEIEQLTSETVSIEEAASLGWLLKAASAADNPTTVTIGQVSETKAQATETFNICLKMHHYWQRKADELAGNDKGVARWFEIQPDSGFIADQLDTIQLLEEYWRDNDISRLYPVV